MSTGSGHLKGALDILLSADVAEVEVELVLLFVELAAGVDDGGLVGGVAVEEIDNVGQVLHAINTDIVDDSRFEGIGTG